MQSQFQIGQKVKAVAFVDCFGNHVDEVPDLTVTDLRLIEPTPILRECDGSLSKNTVAPYFRVQAHKPNGSCCYVEAAERFFAAQ